MPLPATYRGLLGCATREMTDEETLMLIQLCACEQQGVDPFTERLKNEFSFKILSVRAKVHNVALSPQLLVWLVTHGSNPAHLVLWVFTMAVLQHENQRRRLTLTDWMSAFPDGIVTDAEFSRIWELQKIPSEERGGRVMANWLDTPEVWPTLPETVR